MNTKEYREERNGRIQRSHELQREKGLITSFEKDLRLFSNKNNEIDFYVGSNGRALSSRYKEWIGDNKMRDFLNACSSQEAKRVIISDFRKSSFIGNGSTADIRRFELATGINCGRDGNNHAQKVKDLIRQINKVLLKEIPENDIIILQDLLDKLKEVDI